LNFPNRNETAISWHRIPKNVAVNEEQSFDLGYFEECGFYDYKIVRFSHNSIENIENHRFIVQNSFIKKANIHEIVVDLHKANKNPVTGVLESRGHLRKVTLSLNHFERKGIDTLYVAGIHKRAHDDPYSIASRTRIEDTIGGEKEFEELLDEAGSRDMKIIVDLFDRIGSVNMSRKYRKLLVNHIDSQKNFTHFHGANGKSNFSFSSTSILNYRMKAAWDLLIDDAVEFVHKHGVHGLHLDNCDLWPTMKRIDRHELFRKDANGEHSYSAGDILSGQVIDSHEDRVIWPDCSECPNPILIKLMKALWANFPDLIVIGECWQESSEGVVEISGVIPRSHALVKNLTEDILTLTESNNTNVENFKFNDEFLKDY
jgi:hypothetical protein